MPLPVILKKAHELIKTAKTPSLIQQQFFNFLIAATRAEPEKKKEHVIPMSILLYYLDTTRDTRRNKELILKFNDIKTQSVFDGNQCANFKFFDSIKIVKKHQKSLGTCCYSFGSHVQELIKTRKKRAPINLFIERALTSKHSLALYELCLMQKETPWLDHQTLLEFLDLSDSIYKKFKFFNSKILKKSIKEINEKTDISVKVHYQKTGKIITALRLVSQKNSLERFFIDYLAGDTKYMPNVMMPKTKGRPFSPKRLCLKKELSFVLRAFGISSKKLAHKCSIYKITEYDLDKILSLFKTNKKNVLFLYTWLNAHYHTPKN